MPRFRTMITAGMLFLTGVFLTGMACAGLLMPAAAAAPTIARPSATALSTSTAQPLYEQVQLDSSLTQEQGQLFNYRIAAQRPVLVGSDDPRVQKFNSAASAIVDNAIAGFKQNLAALPLTPDPTSSTFDLQYTVVSAPGNILSLKFDIQTYYTGAAHPGHVSQALTFDLDQGRELALADLFLPDADYLTALSKYCVAQLNSRDIGFQGFELGATGSPQNYRNWNITAGGLMITFDEYQVAPYAAGPQIIVIPYRTLASLIQPDGPLGQYLH